MDYGFAAFIDFETTGLNVETDDPVEFAAIIYDPRAKRYVKTLESFFDFDRDMSQEKKDLILKLCGIDYSAILVFDDDGDEFRKLIRYINDGLITHLVAHNAPFDKAFFEKACSLLGIPVPSVIWLDSCHDYPWKDGIKTKALSYLAADHGFLNPFAHRAFADCLTLLGITKQYEWQDILDYAAIPIVRLQALVPFDRKDEAKAQGFRWDAERRIWYIDRKKTFESIEGLYEFSVREISGGV